MMVGNLIENYFVTTGEWNFGSAISLITGVPNLFLADLRNATLSGLAMPV